MENMEAGGGWLKAYDSSLRNIARIQVITRDFGANWSKDGKYVKGLYEA